MQLRDGRLLPIVALAMAAIAARILVGVRRSTFPVTVNRRLEVYERHDRSSSSKR